MTSLLKRLRTYYPYTPPGELHPQGEAHEFIWNIALREGREQVIRWIEKESGVTVPTPDPLEDYVLDAEGGGPAPADTCARRSPGSQ